LSRIERAFASLTRGCRSESLRHYKSASFETSLALPRAAQECILERCRLPDGHLEPLFDTSHLAEVFSLPPVARGVGYSRRQHFEPLDVC
jgi:hypothetical protein